MKKILLLIVLVLSACVGNEDDDDANQIPNSLLVKEVAVSVLSPNPDLTINSAHISLGASNSQLIRAVIGITNNSNINHCIIFLNNLDYKSQSNVVIENQTEATVSGSILESGISGFYFNCLKPGETGYGLDLFPNNQGNRQQDFNNISQIEISSITSSTSGSFLEPQQRLEMLGQATFINGIVSAEITNTGTAPLSLFQARYILEDANGVPVYFGFYNVFNLPDRIIDPGEINTIMDIAFFDGQATSVRTFLDYDPVSPPVVITGEIETQQLESRIHQFRAVSSKQYNLMKEIRDKEQQQ